ncbi:MAG: tRNA pseudouridine(55) synthase TruB [Butyrivibrio sp.]|nr:tRNA pseudouridine(55) synthase TruB [Butyrivibrio sp.]
MIDGIINIYKEKGFTSHDVVAKMRGILKQKKIGHTGTLDPDATGVLPVCLGSGTKLCDMLTDKSKEYEAVVLLGKTTDTEDVSGAVIEEKTVTASEEEIKSVIMSFMGEYMQIPPMYSALKVNGKKLYELARQGIEVERKARPVVISELTILSMDLPRVTIRVSCSKGTYIRSLCRDMGEIIGCGACMESLVRTRVGSFLLKDAVSLKQLEENREKIEEFITPVDACFEEYRKVYAEGRNAVLVSNGNMFRVHIADAKDSELFRVYISDGDNGQFAGVYKFSGEKNCFLPQKMFLSGEK